MFAISILVTVYLTLLSFNYLFTFALTWRAALVSNHQALIVIVGIPVHSQR
jgi:hypothetical protein